MKPSKLLNRILTGAAVFAVYIVAGKLSLRLASVHPSVSPVWPPTGIAIATLLMLGRRFWPSIFAGAFIVNVTTTVSIASSLGIALGNTLEAVVATSIVTRFASGRHAFEKSWDVRRVGLCAGVMRTGLAATIGDTSLTLGGFASGNEY